MEPRPWTGLNPVRTPAAGPVVFVLWGLSFFTCEVVVCNPFQLLEGWSTVLLALLFVFSVYTPPPTSYPSQLGSKLCLEREGRRGPRGPQLQGFIPALL